MALVGVRAARPWRLQRHPQLRYGGLWQALGWVIVAIIVYLSVTAPVRVPLDVKHLDKWTHLLAYGVLMGWWMQLYHGRIARLVVALACTALGVLMECVQALNPQRYYDVADMLANGLGVLIAYLLGMTPMDRLLLAVERLVQRHD